MASTIPYARQATARAVGAGLEVTLLDANAAVTSVGVRVRAAGEVAYTSNEVVLPVTRSGTSVVALYAPYGFTTAGVPAWDLQAVPIDAAGQRGAMLVASESEAVPALQSISTVAQSQTLLRVSWVIASADAASIMYVDIRTRQAGGDGVWDPAMIVDTRTRTSVDLALNMEAYSYEVQVTPIGPRGGAGAPTRSATLPRLNAYPPAAPARRATVNGMLSEIVQGQIYGNGAYVLTASSSSGPNYGAAKVITYSTTTGGWASIYTYDPATSMHIGRYGTITYGYITTVVAGEPTPVAGEWLEMALPAPIYLSRYMLVPANPPPPISGPPSTWRVCALVDGEYQTLHRVTNYTWNGAAFFDVSPGTALAPVTNFRIICERCPNVSVAIGQFRLYS